MREYIKLWIRLLYVISDIREALLLSSWSLTLWIKESDISWLPVPSLNPPVPAPAAAGRWHYNLWKPELPVETRFASYFLYNTLPVLRDWVPECECNSPCLYGTLSKCLGSAPLSALNTTKLVYFQIWAVDAVALLYTATRLHGLAASRHTKSHQHSRRIKTSV